MAKKMKPNVLFDAPAEEQEAAESKLMQDTKHNADGETASKLRVDMNPAVGNGRLTAADVEKLAKYDAMEQSLASLSEEKSVLEAKLVEYAEKLSEKKLDADAGKLREENAKLKEQVKKLEAGAPDIGKLEREVKSLREENDSYLMKISELTFENAKLTCQLSELENAAKSSGASPNQPKYSPIAGSRPRSSGLAQPGRDAYNPYANNGYASW